MIHKTKGIVMRAVKYGETSLIVSIFTEKFGIQSYIVNGVRSEKKNKEKASHFLPASFLELEVYHHESRGIHRIKESSCAIIFHSLTSDIIKNNIALFMMELLYKSLKHPETNEALFDFCIDALQQLDTIENNLASCIPLHFALQLPHHLGFGITNASTKELQHENIFLDLIEGKFATEHPGHENILSNSDARTIAQLLISGPSNITNLTNTGNILEKFLEFYSLHITDFGKIRSFPFLMELLS